MSVAAQFAMQDHLPPDWKRYSVYAAKVVFEYHNDQGPEFNIHLDPTVGVRLLGEDILPNAVLLGCGWAPDNHRWKLLREHGNLHWQAKYAMSTPVPLEKGSSGGYWNSGSEVRCLTDAFPCTWSFKIRRGGEWASSRY